MLSFLKNRFENVKELILPEIAVTKSLQRFMENGGTVKDQINVLTLTGLNNKRVCVPGSIQWKSDLAEARTIIFKTFENTNKTVFASSKQLQKQGVFDCIVGEWAVNSKGKKIFKPLEFVETKIFVGEKSNYFPEHIGDSLRKKERNLEKYFSFGEIKVKKSCVIFPEGEQQAYLIEKYLYANPFKNINMIPCEKMRLTEAVLLEHNTNWKRLKTLLDHNLIERNRATNNIFFNYMRLPEGKLYSIYENYLFDFEYFYLVFNNYFNIILIFFIITLFSFIFYYKLKK